MFPPTNHALSNLHMHPKIIFPGCEYILEIWHLGKINRYTAATLVWECRAPEFNIEHTHNVMYI